MKKQAAPFAVALLALLYSFLVSAYSYVPVAVPVKKATGKNSVQATAVSAGSTFYITAAYRLNCTAPVYTEPGAAAKQAVQFMAAAAVTESCITAVSLQYLHRARRQCLNLHIARLLFPFHHFW